MKYLCMFILLVLLQSFAVAVTGSDLPPKSGVYKSMDQPGGSVLTGHFSESWMGSGEHGEMGNTINTASWNGAVLGGEWMFWCMNVETPAYIVSDSRDANGTGEVTKRTEFRGGRFWLSKDGPWSWDHQSDFTGYVEKFDVVTTYQYVENEVLVMRSNVISSAMFDVSGATWGGLCMVYEIYVAVYFGNTDENGALPLDFPIFLDSSYCPSQVPSGPGRGAWGDVTHVSLQINDCVVSNEAVSWGKIKSIYK